MFEVMCISCESSEKRVFVKDEIKQKEIKFENEEILIRHLTVTCKRGKIKRKTLRKLEKITANEENVYTDSDSIKHLEKNKNNERVINHLPTASFKKWANLCGTSLSDTQFALVTENPDKAEKERIFKIASLVKLLNIYNCKDKNLADEILEKTGLCVTMADGIPFESVVIHTKDSLVFEDKRLGEKVYDLSIELPKKMKEFKNLPMERILENALKCERGEKIFKKNKLKIGSFYRQKTL